MYEGRSLRTLNQAIDTLKIFEIYTNENSLNLMINYVSALFNVDSSDVKKLMNT